MKYWWLWVWKCFNNNWCVSSNNAFSNVYYSDQHCHSSQKLQKKLKCMWHTNAHYGVDFNINYNQQYTNSHNVQHPYAHTP